MMKRNSILVMAIIVVTLLVVPVLAQTSGGQICIRSFEDRNSNGILDVGEPLITRSVSASLTDSAGIIIGTQLLDDSSRAAQGIMCFQFLDEGQYTVSVTSADYNATGSNTFQAAVSGLSAEVFDFGARSAIEQSESATSDSSAPASGASRQSAALQRLIFGAVGAVVITVFMLIAGAVIYFVYFQPRLNRLKASQPAYAAVGGPPPDAVYQQPPAPRPQEDFSDTRPMPPGGGA